MGTMIAHPVMPADIAEKVGASARERLDILERRRTELEIRGDLRPATIYNLSPFILRLGSGLIPFSIPKCPEGKKFHAETVTTIRSYPIFTGNREMSDRSIKSKWDVNILTPLMQAMEFKHFYIGESEEDQGIRQGGVVVIDGEPGGLRPESEVRTPIFMFRKNNRYITLEKATLGDLMSDADKMMKLRCTAMLDQADIWFDDEDTRKNIQAPERIWHDFALRRQWISGPRPWRTTNLSQADRCPRCAQQYVSKTGVCKCSFVYDPFVAYMHGEILADNVRMSVLKKEQWEKVNAEEARRKEARGA